MDFKASSFPALAAFVLALSTLSLGACASDDETLPPADSAAEDGSGESVDVSVPDAELAETDEPDSDGSEPDTNEASGADSGQPDSGESDGNDGGGQDIDESPDAENDDSVSMDDACSGDSCAPAETSDTSDADSDALDTVQECMEPRPDKNCTNAGYGCDEGLDCLPSWYGCFPSECFCTPAGEWVCNADCNTNELCIRIEADACDGPNPELSCFNLGCDDGFECVGVDLDANLPGDCSCNGGTGTWECTSRGRPDFECVPVDGE